MSEEATLVERLPLHADRMQLGETIAVDDWIQIKADLREAATEITRLQAANAELSKCADGLAKLLTEAEVALGQLSRALVVATSVDVTGTTDLRERIVHFLTHRKGTGQ